MRRLYFLIPTPYSAHEIVNELLLARVHSEDIHIVAREGTELGDLPEASITQSSDLLPALERGLAVGGATGVLAGLVAVTFPPAGLVLGGGAVLGIALAGAGVGAWVSGMIGINVENSQIHAFEKAIAAGELLMMIDVPKSRVTEITALVHQHHPEAEVEGTEPTIPAFP
ncbi:MAG: ammonium transporter [Chromatiales bacterium]|nr:ammonium transporter [Gammaproteobacteria bacterium]MCP5352192.1 ammonium transporter [Chromatiales bacterium]